MDTQNFQNAEQPQVVPTAPNMQAYEFDGQQTAPVMTVKDWIITFLIMLIPLVNIIFLFIWAFGGSENNPNKVNWAKASLIWFAIMIVLYIIFIIIFGAIFATMMGGLGGGSSVY